MNARERKFRAERKDYFSVKVLSRIICVSECFADVDACVRGLLSSNGTLDNVSVVLNTYKNNKRTEIPFVRI